MTRLCWIMAALGVAFFEFFAVAIVFDVELVKHHAWTISHWTMILGDRHPAWFPLLVACPFLFAIGGFYGHFWSPGNVDFGQTARMWLPPVLIAPIILYAGLIFGRHFFSQTF